MYLRYYRNTQWPVCTIYYAMHMYVHNINHACIGNQNNRRRAEDRRQTSTESKKMRIKIIQLFFPDHDVVITITILPVLVFSLS